MDPYSLDHIVLPSSFAKNVKIVGPTRVELVTSSLSEKRSNQLSYDPIFYDAVKRYQRREEFSRSF
jgi:hypothetical protein